ncbi:MAG TPA: hypothetical protein VMT89_11845, partial [Candidatus Acidoferrales bacterium]|nr:hypothetical protein [Candidatus Acidoferrales bacterium]
MSREARGGTRDDTDGRSRILSDTRRIADADAFDGEYQLQADAESWKEWSRGLGQTPTRHLGGGRKGVLLLLRYVYIIAASYLLIFSAPSGRGFFVHGVMIAAALASNVALSFVPERLVFSWFVEAPVLVGDTLWVAWALHSTGPSGQELFLLYFFVLFLAVVGENILLVVLSSTAVSAAEFHLSSRQDWLTSKNLL